LTSIEHQGDEEQDGGDDGEHGGLIVPAVYGTGHFPAAADLSYMHLTRRVASAHRYICSQPASLSMLTPLGVARASTRRWPRGRLATTNADIPARTRQGSEWPTPIR
jgi:hypothetical protein